MFAALAETLIPASDTMLGHHRGGVRPLLDQALGYRPDLVDALTAALTPARARTPKPRWTASPPSNQSSSRRSPSWPRGAYFLSPAVKAAMPYDAAPRPARDDMDSYVDMLEHVVDRGFVIR